MEDEEQDYSWSQELRNWERRQEYYERLCLDNQDVNDEWKDGVLSEIQQLTNWYKKN